MCIRDRNKFVITVATVITNLFSAIPLVGESITTWLWGGYSVDNPTLTRFFTLHYLIPFLILGLVVLHIWALHVPGNNNPVGIDIKKPSKDTVPFHPYIVIKDAFALLMFLILFAMFVFYSPNVLGHADNYIEANPLVTCLLYTSPSPRDRTRSRMPSSA